MVEKRKKEKENKEKRERKGRKKNIRAREGRSAIPSPWRHSVERLPSARATTLVSMSRVTSVVVQTALVPGDAKK